MSIPEGCPQNPTFVAWLATRGVADSELPVAHALPRLRLDEEDPTADLLLRGRLGAGGMAVVTRAEQRSLGRDVAVKRCLAPGDPRVVRALLREAWITGQLDHPNIVPVHLVGETEEGEPIVVLRAIGGQSWSARIAEDPPRDPEALARHLAIFVSVCNAVHFAHERGFLHRDIKPSNVRIGDFGEVYLLDWGVAERLDQPEVSRAGTPAYLAPEMLEAGPPDRRTDVFLLGATLLHALTGAPPRDETTSSRVAEGVVEAAEIQVPDDLPAGLAPLLAAACATSPADRLPTAEALRDAVLAWQAEQGVQLLLRGARERLEALREAVECARGDRSDRRAAEIARERFAGARFAFEQVLADRPDHAEARDGLGQTLEAMIGLELDGDHMVSARALLAAHPDPSPALTESVGRRIADIERANADRERLASLARAYDTSVILRDWVVVFGATAAGVVLAIVVLNLLLGPPAEVRDQRLSLFLLPPACCYAVAVYARRQTLLAQPVGQALVLSTSGFLAVAVGARVLAPLAGIPIANAVTLEPFLIVAWLFGGSVYLRGLVPVAVLGLAGAAGNLFMRGTAWAAVSHNTVTVLLLVGIGVAWWRRLRADGESAGGAHVGA